MHLKVPQILAPTPQPQRHSLCIFCEWTCAGNSSVGLRMVSSIAVFGGNGLTGSEVVYQALDRGCKVTAFCRDPSKLKVTTLLLSVVSLHTPPAIVSPRYYSQRSNES